MFNQLSELINILKSIDLTVLEGMAKRIANQMIKSDVKLLVVGCGGSAAQAGHMAGELLGRYKKERKALRCIDLTSFNATTTAISNDYTFDNVFTRCIEGCGRPGDILLCLSTSGYTKALVNAIRYANQNAIETYALLGKDGGDMVDICDNCYIVPSYNTPRIQETHLLIIHYICGIIENYV